MTDPRPGTRASRSSLIRWLGWSAVGGLLIAALIAPGAATSTNAPGNNGTVKIHEGATETEPTDKDNEPHVCTFHLHFFFADPFQSGTWEIQEWSPGDKGTVVLSGTYDTNSDGEDRSPKEGVYTLPDGHYKLFWDGDLDTEKHDKMKVFWVDCPEATASPSFEQSPGAETETPGVTETPGAETETPGVTETPGAETETPGATGTPGAETETPGATESPGAETETPGATESPGAETETPGATGTPGAETETPGATPTFGQSQGAETETPGATESPGAETETPGATPTFGQSVGAETSAPSFFQSVGAETNVPGGGVSQPPTDTASLGGSPDSSGWRILLIALAGLLATILVLTPSEQAIRRR